MSRMCIYEAERAEMASLLTGIGMVVRNPGVGGAWKWRR